MFVIPECWMHRCQGLGSIQQNLRHSIDKMEKLEATVQRLQLPKVLPAAPSAGETAGVAIAVSAAVEGLKVKSKSKGKVK